MSREVRDGWNTHGVRGIVINHGVRGILMTHGVDEIVFGLECVICGGLCHMLRLREFVTLKMWHTHS